MAPPVFPNGITLHAIGFAALKYPSLPPPPFDVPLTNIVGALQHQPSSAQNHMIAQIASQYLNVLLEYQTSSATPLHDPSSPQYYFPTSMCLLNYLASSNPDVCKRIAAYPGLLNGVVEKLLAPNFVQDMKAVNRPRIGAFLPATFDDDFGSVLQFLSTILLYAEEIDSLHPRIRELIPKMKLWKREFRNSRVVTIKNAAARLVDQIEGMDSSMIEMVRKMQAESMVCGVQNCGVRGADRLTVCTGCKVQRYCGEDHQKADWKYHKHICDKGLVEPQQAEGGAQ